MVIQLKVTLRHVHPPIWRRLQVDGDMTLAQFHNALQITLGWTNSHRHQFVIAGETYGLPSDDPRDEQPADERKFRMRRFALVNAQFVYEYDFGDGWQYDVLVEKVEQTEPFAPALCLDGERACPPEDCGGPPGYAELQEILADPEHKEHRRRLKWLGGPLDPEAFSLALVNHRLATKGPRPRGIDPARIRRAN